MGSSKSCLASPKIKNSMGPPAQWADRLSFFLYRKSSNKPPGAYLLKLSFRWGAYSKGRLFKGTFSEVGLILRFTVNDLVCFSNAQLLRR